MTIPGAGLRYATLLFIMAATLHGQTKANTYLSTGSELVKDIDFHEAAAKGASLARTDAGSKTAATTAQFGQGSGTEAVAYVRDDGLTVYEGRFALRLGGLFDLPSVALENAVLTIPPGKRLLTGFFADYGFGVQRLVGVYFEPSQSGRPGKLYFDSNGEIARQESLKYSMKTEWQVPEELQKSDAAKAGEILRLLNEAEFQGWASAGLLLRDRRTGALTVLDAGKGTVNGNLGPVEFLKLDGSKAKLR